MSDIDPTVKDPETADGNPTVPNDDKDSSSTGDERLDLPIVPTQDELTPEQKPPINNVNPIDAPYGLNKDGTPAKKRGRKPATESETAALHDKLDSVTPARPLPRANAAAKGSQPVMPPSQSIVTDYRVMGETAANLWFNVGTAALGDDWKPEGNEPKLIAGAFTDYFRSKEIKVIDPTIVLVIALGSYTVSRVNKPTVKTKLGGFVAWLKSKAKR
jgi:preprotein translocase subunit Sec61beta